MYVTKSAEAIAETINLNAAGECLTRDSQKPPDGQSHDDAFASAMRRAEARERYEGIIEDFSPQELILLGRFASLLREGQPLPFD